MSILKIENLHASYGSITALKDINLEVNEGEICSIIGANGAGKTTLLSCISGIMPYTGTISFNGQPLGGKIDSSKIVQMGIVQVPEGRQIFSELTVAENLRMGAYIRNRKDDIQSEIDWLYSIFPRLDERKNQKGGSLSGGEQQMLAMARALLAKPKLLLLDEPSMGLAPIIVADIFKIINQLHQQGITIMLIEQNAKLALQTADRGYVIETGEIMLSGTAEELAGNDEIKKLYLGG